MMTKYYLYIIAFLYVSNALYINTYRDKDMSWASRFISWIISPIVPWLAAIMEIGARFRSPGR